MNGFYDFPYLGNGKSYQLRSCRHIFQRGGFETTNRHGCPGIIERIFNHDTQKKTTMMGSKSPNWTIVFFYFFYIPKVGCSISLTLKQQWKQEFLMELGMIIRCMRCGKPMGKPVWKVIYKCWVFLNYVKVYRRINCMFNWEKDAKSWEFGIVWGC